MNTEILVIGDEIISGHITDTNSSWLAKNLFVEGFPVKHITAAGDKLDEIISVLKNIQKRSRLLFITGGLGPTHDDITRQALARFFKKRLVMHRPSLRRIHNFLASRNYPVPKCNSIQAMIPADFNIIPNQTGTAPGFYYQTEKFTCFCMPGVPSEMKAMMQSFILPLIKKKFIPEIFRTAILKTAGIGESLLFEKTGRFVGGPVRVAFLPSAAGVDIRFSISTGEDPGGRIIKNTLRDFRKCLGRHIISNKNETLSGTAGRLLVKHKKTIALAESCTGGLASSMLTDLPGSSAFFTGTVVCYHNNIKRIIGVKKNTLEKFGAVSRETALELAWGIRKYLHTGLGLAITGIAGPGGGSKTKPVGTVWIALSDGKKSCAEKYRFWTERSANKERFACAALHLIIKFLKS